MFFVAGSVIFFGCLLAGWGGLCVRYMRFETDNPWVYPYLGMFAAGILFSAASMFVPLNGVALAAFVLVGLIGLPLWGRALRAWRLGHSREACGVFLLFIAACTVTLAAHCAHTEWSASYAYDTDLYHANTVRWLNEYGTPPGLANLHTRLGMNSVWLTLSGLFDNGYWDNRTAWVMPVLLYSCAIPYLLHIFLFNPGRIASPFCGAMLLFVIGGSTRLSYPSLYYDLPALFINIAVFAECLARAEDGWDITPGQASLITSFAALAFTIKPLTGVSVLFAAGVALYGLKKTQRLSIAHFSVAFAPAATAGIVWMARNCLLSGYPLFPLPLISLPVDWATPKVMALGNYEAIIGWARTPGPGYWQSLHTWSWIAPWLKRNIEWQVFWLYTGLPLLAGIPLWFRALCRRGRVLSAFFGVWVALCLLYWFVTAPALRFGGIFFQVFFAMGLAFAFHQTMWLSAWEINCAKFLQSGRACLLMSAIILLMAIIVNAGQLHSPKRNIFHVGSIPARELSSRTLDTSVSPPLKLFFPVNGDDRCGNSPLPCTPHDNPSLSLRLPGSLGGGFYFPYSE